MGKIKKLMGFNVHIGYIIVKEISSNILTIFYISHNLKKVGVVFITY